MCPRRLTAPWKMQGYPLESVWPRWTAWAMRIGAVNGRSKERLSFSGKEFGDGDKVPIHMPYVLQME